MAASCEPGSGYNLPPGLVVETTSAAKNGWKDCQFPSFQIGPPRISINPWQFEGFLTPAGEHGRITTRRGI